jgi:hypothetical protein
MPENRNNSASFTYTAYTIYKTLCPNDDIWKGESQPQQQKEGYEAESLPSQTNLSMGQAGKPGLPLHA